MNGDQNTTPFIRLLTDSCEKFQIGEIVDLIYSKMAELLQNGQFYQALCCRRDEEIVLLF